MSDKRPYHALRHKDYRRLWISMLVSLTGSQMQSVAIDWHVYVLTRDPLALGLVGLFRVVPIIIFSLIGGVVADRRDRRAIMLCTQTTMTIVAAALAYLTFAGKESVGLLYALTAISAAANAFDNPARQALLPRLVGAEDLPGALALNLTVFQASAIGGPALAGLLIATGHGGIHEHVTSGGLTVVDDPRHGLAQIYLLNAISFIAVIATLIFMRASGKVESDAPARREPPVESLKVGLRFVFSTPIMVWTLGLDFFATMFAGAMSLMPIFANEVLGCGPAGYGWLRAAPALGALAGSFYTAVYPLPRRQGAVLLASVGIYGAATIVFGISKSFVLTLAALAISGVADLVSTVIRSTLRQLLTPDDMRGRMTSINMIFFMGGPQLGELEAGFVAKYAGAILGSVAAGAVVSVVSGGVLTLLATAVVWTATPIVRRYVQGPPPAKE